MVFFVGAGPIAADQLAARVRWITYRSDALHAKITVPAAWVANRSTSALAFHSPGNLDIRAGVGLMRSPSEASIEESADVAKAEEGLVGCTKKYLKIGGLRAMQVVGNPKGNSQIKLARYFISAPSGPYLVQCIAPAKTWTLYRGLFDTIIDSIRFT
jgi:hypothetical protein